MPLPQIPPGRGGQPRRVHFAHCPPERGKFYHAFSAGPCHWFDCHWHQREKDGCTKPCVKAMTGAELTCPWCEKGQAAEETGYQPLYRDLDGKPVFVVVHCYSRDQVDKLTPFKQVLVGRGGSKHDGVYVIPGPAKDKWYQSTLAERKRHADLTETLLRVWGLPELVDWYTRTHGRTDSPVSPPARTLAAAAAPEKFAKGPIERLREAEDRALAEAAAEEQRIGSTMNFLIAKAVGKNGKVHHDKK